MNHLYEGLYVPDLPKIEKTGSLLTTDKTTLEHMINPRKDIKMDTRTNKGNKMNKTISLNVKVMPKASISEVTEAMAELAEKLGIIIQAKFNGVNLATWYGGDAECLEQSYYALLDNKKEQTKETK